MFPVFPHHSMFRDILGRAIRGICILALSVAYCGCFGTLHREAVARAVWAEAGETIVVSDADGQVSAVLHPGRSGPQAIETLDEVGSVSVVHFGRHVTEVRTVMSPQQGRVLWEQRVERYVGVADVQTGLSPLLKVAGETKSIVTRVQLADEWDLLLDGSSRVTVRSASEGKQGSIDAFYIVHAKTAGSITNFSIGTAIPMAEKTKGTARTIGEESAIRLAPQLNWNDNPGIVGLSHRNDHTDNQLALLYMVGWRDGMRYGGPTISEQQGVLLRPGKETKVTSYFDHRFHDAVTVFALVEHTIPSDMGTVGHTSSWFDIEPPSDGQSVLVSTRDMATASPLRQATYSQADRRIEVQWSDDTCSGRPFDTMIVDITAHHPTKGLLMRWKIVGPRSDKLELPTLDDNSESLVRDALLGSPPGTEVFVYVSALSTGSPRDERWGIYQAGAMLDARSTGGPQSVVSCSSGLAANTK